MNNMKEIVRDASWLKASAFTASCMMSAPAASATVVFTDNTFDLADYTIDAYQTTGATVDITQSMTLGNPGSALRIVSSIPTRSSTFYTAEYLLNGSFLYDPSIQGAITSIDFSVDMYAGISPGGLNSKGDSAFLYQGGNYYLSYIPATSVVNGVWDTISQNGLQASDFNLITDPLTFAMDSTAHPDFTGGLIQFGVLSGTTTGGTVALTWDIRLDNLSYTVNAVPLPAAFWLFGSGLLGLIGLAKRKAA